MQLIILVEANSKSKSDFKYIDKVLRTLFVIDSSIKINPIYMGSKTKYAQFNKKIKIEIDKYYGESNVIMCIDIDNPSQNLDQQKLTLNIMEYCKKNDIDLVWFNKTIEDVFLGKVISRNKDIEANKFLSKGSIPKKEFLENNNYSKQSSNIILIFKRYLKLK